MIKNDWKGKINLAPSESCLGAQKLKANISNIKIRFFQKLQLVSYVTEIALFPKHRAGIYFHSRQ